jgi:ribosomal protein S10
MGYDPRTRDLDVSFVGVAKETGYESQVPISLPQEREEITIPEDWWRTGSPPN